MWGTSQGSYKQEIEADRYKLSALFDSTSVNKPCEKAGELAPALASSLGKN